MAGFRVLAGVDLEPRYMATFAHNFPDSQSLRLDLSKTPPSEFMSQLGIAKGELTLLAGGPPCQGFSKNVPRKQRFLDSANNKLVKTFLDLQ
jgi:DNA (cytosine-5)-methyltransferase 1